MKRSVQAVLIAGVVTLALFGLSRCNLLGLGATISISDHSDALTTGGTDNLFILTLTKAPEGYVLTDIQITAHLAGQTATVLNFAGSDANSNGQLDAGESLTCVEPGANVFDQTTVGQPVVVDFTKKLGSNTVESVATGTWTPAN